MLSPYYGLCIGCGWYDGVSVCPIPIEVYFDTLFTQPYIAVNFAGRGKVGPLGGCGGSDTYVTFFTLSGFPDIRAKVDVWAAHKDGVWSSSTTILFYAGGIELTSTVKAKDHVTTLSSGSVTSNVYSCGSTLLATVTVNDDGTFSVA